MTTSYDAIVIGAGQAGPALAVRLAKSGLKTALIEREHLGGTCVNDGCIPTKTLVASARAAHVARRAGDWGVRISGPIAVDMKAVKARKDRVVADSIASLCRKSRMARRAARMARRRSGSAGSSPVAMPPSGSFSACSSTARYSRRSSSASSDGSPSISSSAAR